MSDLLARLEGFPPAALWTLAPKPLLMQGAGLLATGDISNLSWTGDGQIEVEFPNRLESLVHRLRLNGGRIEGCCDCSAPQPCAHHLASLMLCMHLMKDFGAFGRLPNRVLAERLKARLLRKDERAVIADRPKKEQSTRHILIRPAEPQIFTFRDSFSSQARDKFASVPVEVRPFCTPWNSSLSQEAAFWKWFTTPERQLPVFIELEQKVLTVEPASMGGWQGSAVLDLSPEGLKLKRALQRDGERVGEDFIAVGEGLVYFPATKWLVRLPLTAGWHQWNAIVNALKPRAFGFMVPSTRTVEAGNEMAIDIDNWNDAGFKWWGTSADATAYPTLHWQGEQEASPPDHPVQASLRLSPSGDKRLLTVEVRAHVDDTEIPCDHVLHIEDALHMMGYDGSLLSTKARRSAILGTLYECWLEEVPSKRNALLRTLQEATAFKTTAHSRAAVKMVKDLLKQAGEAGGPMLCASAETGWFTISNTFAAAQKATALARGILGAVWADEVPGYDDADDEASSPLVVHAEQAFPKLPALLGLCQQHGVKLTYAAHAVEVMSLQCSVAVQQGEALDWFEMKTEVRSGTSLIPQEEWERILSSGHVIDAETGALKVVDVKSMDGLKRLQHLLGRQRQEQRAAAKGTTLEDLVAIPRMRLLDWLILSKYGIECELPASERQVLESLLSFDSLQREQVPASIRATLRDYQVAGYSWLAFLYRHGFGGCLADDMGLGKTLQTITLLAAIDEGAVMPLGEDREKRPHLLVVPPTLLFNWENEIRVFCPELRVHEYTGKGRSLIGIRQGVVITTYDIARRDIDSLRNARFDCVIFDEAQNVKNLGGERSKAMRQLQGRFKLVLTGTPMENHVGEYYSIIDLAVPGLFGDFKTFMDAMKQPNGIFNPLDRARPFVLRRTKDKILKELPPKVESDMHLELTEEQKRFYTRAVGEVRQEVLAAFEDKSAQQAGIVALAALTRLRQICVSPALIDPEHTEVSPKLQYLLDKVEELREEGHSALVFSQFTKALDQLEKHLREAGISFLRLDGSTPQQKRKELVESFQSGKGPSLFLISLKAGGAGLNLTRASYVFHLDPWWNPAVENQASDRAHRMGQKSTVFIQRLLMLHTVEEKIMQLKARKSELFDRVLSGAEGDRATGAVITKEDFKFLLE